MMKIFRVAACFAAFGAMSVAAVMAQTKHGGGASGHAAASNVLDVRQFGARGDGSTFDTAAIQKALDTAGAAGGGTVRVPAGTYLLQPIHLRAHVTFQLDEGALLRASDDPRDFLTGEIVDGEKRILSLINGKRLDGAAITGRGIIDGSGQRWWRSVRPVTDFYGHEDPPRPRIVNLAACQQMTVEGVTLRNAPLFHLVFNNCDHVTVRNVTITSPPDSLNTDGIDPDGCRDVLITGCRIDTGDDDIAIKSFRPGAACSHIVVSHCDIGHGHGISIGGETVGGVSDVAIEHCTFANTRYGFRIKSSRGHGGVVENIRVSDIQMKNVDPAIDIMCYYPNPSEDDVAQPMQADTPVYRNIHIENLTATCPREAGLFIGLPESPITDCTLTNVHVSARSPFVIRDARVVQE